MDIPRKTHWLECDEVLLAPVRHPTKCPVDSGHLELQRYAGGQVKSFRVCIRCVFQQVEQVVLDLRVMFYSVERVADFLMTFLVSLCTSLNLTSSQQAESITC